ncbi:TPA: Fic family protein, partial [Legionella pneumophila]
MKIEDFQSGQWISQYKYKSFLPIPVNQEWYWEDPQINTSLEKASRALAELDSFTLIVPDVDLFIQMHITKEANTSSRIEGTQTNFDEALMGANFITPEKRNDWQEVQNYIKAINEAVKELKTLPLSNRLLKQTHKILMYGVRGEHKMPGEYRISQNWIGGSSLSDATFIPPHQDNVPELMSDLEKFWHNEKINVPDLIRIAISHYQFETIHPFLDGNGRIGRLLITLYLVEKGLLQKPSLYLSDFFERNRSSYYDALMAVRTSNNLLHWIKFFLSAVIEIANNG